MHVTEFSNPGCVLFLGAHCDDIEIGCGATVLKLRERFPDATFHWVVFSSDPIREQEALNSAGVFLDGVTQNHIEINEFRNAYFPDQWADLKRYFF